MGSLAIWEFDCNAHNPLRCNQGPTGNHTSYLMNKVTQRLNYIDITLTTLMSITVRSRTSRKCLETRSLWALNTLQDPLQLNIPWMQSWIGGKGLIWNCLSALGSEVKW